MAPVAPPGGRPTIIACGALTGELRAVLDQEVLTDRVEVRYLPANLHNRPERIVPAIEALLDELGDRPVFLGYADCGTGGHLDELCRRRPGLARLPGAHCYEVFAGTDLFTHLHDEEPGTFYLTDYLARHFDALIWQGLGLADHPELIDVYFANYRRVVLLSQSEDTEVLAAAEHAAGRLGLGLVHHHVGRDRLSMALPVSIRSHGAT